MASCTLEREAPETGNPQLAAALVEVASLVWRYSEAAEEPQGLAGGWGHYTGLPPRIQLEDDGRTATLLSPLSYFGTDGREWEAPTGSSLDGASIPRAFWSIIGGPFEGKYRNGSIVHDRFCDYRVRTWRETHRMFHDAMRCSGTPAVQARIMFYAVYRFGPRWPDPGTALAGESERWWPPIDTASLVADAQAIALHGLNVDEIEALADARDARAMAGGTDFAFELAEAAANGVDLLVVPGGTGGPEDVDVVARAAAMLPTAVVRRFRRKGIRIVACRGSVTDFERDLAGVVPRGWEGLGKTWDDVPGAYLDNRKRVVIGTVETDGRRAVPTFGHGHGSVDLVLHESLHGFDYSGGHAVLKEAAFKSARDTDFSRLGPYEKQEGRAGAEETFAESGARFAVEPEAMRTFWPALHGYWSHGPLDLELAGGGGEGEAFSMSPPAIGIASPASEGCVHVQLRAEGDGGAIGHAWFALAPGENGYERLANRSLQAEDASAWLIAPSIDEE